MRRRRALLLLILIYVTLDMSLCEMPGAFVFDPTESVESVDVGRGRLTAKLVVLPTPTSESLMHRPDVMRRDFRHRLPPGGEVVVSSCRSVVNCLPRAATYAVPHLSEDPH
jgi:hypothetical protein